MPINLPTNLLRNFVAIVETGSMLSASNTVFVTQSALSLQIKRLEYLLQQDLFHRDGRRLKLTQSGEVMLAFSRQLLRLHDEAIATVAAGVVAGRPAIPARMGAMHDTPGLPQVVALDG